MAAPALVALATASRDPRTARTLTALVEAVSAQRPDLRIELALLPAPAPLAGGRAVAVKPARAALPAVVDRLVSGGFDEVVVVPLTLLASAEEMAPLVAAVVAEDERHDDVAVRLTAPLGLETCLLEVLDERLRETLRAARIRELDALVLAAPGSNDVLVNQSVARLARVWGTHHRLPVTAAYAASAPPATGEAVRAFRGQGRRHVAVASLFLTPGELTDRATELALEAGAIAVAEPLGAHAEVARLVLARYAVGAVDLVPV